MTDKRIDNAAAKARGLRPDPQSSRDADAQTCPFRPRLGASPGLGYIRDPRWIRDQDATQSCAGQAVAACVDGQSTTLAWCSARSLWLDALRREGLPPDSNAGTYLSLVVEGLVSRGWDPYREGEDRFPLPSEWRTAETLEEEMYAADHRQSAAIRRSRVTETGQARVAAVALALADASLEVVVGGGTRDALLSFHGDEHAPAQVLGTDYFGGSTGGHARRLLGFYRDGAEYVFVEQNSWGVNWGGCRLPRGQWLSGCCLTSAQVLIEDWDVHVLHLHP